MERALIATPHGHVHVWSSRGVGRPLLALHMSPRSGAMFRPMAEALDRPVAAPDRLGFGFSDALAEPVNVRRWAESSRSVVDALGWAKYDVLGVHTGSVEALELARMDPRLRRVALFSVPCYSPTEVEERRRGVAAPRPRPEADGSHLVQLWRRRSGIRPSSTSPDLLHRLVVEEALSLSTVHLAYAAVLGYPTAERLRLLDRPLVVFAPHDDLEVQTNRAKASLPEGAEVVDLPHLGLDAFELAGPTVASLIDEFLPERRSGDC